MTDYFNRQAIKVSVAQTCQAVGWTSIQTTPLELLTDLIQSYIKRLSHQSSCYANFYGQSEPNLDHVALAFKDMGINVNDLQEYVTYVDNNNVLELPMYPLPKESHLNLLKPGSREVVTRPVHIHEHLPPMHPHLEEPEYPMKASPTSNENSPAETPANARGLFKRPLDVSQEPVSRRTRLLPEEEIRPLREISSVMMTTSGFLSHAREGKLPESRSIPPIEEDPDDSPLEESAAEHEKIATPAPATTEAKSKKKSKSSDGGKKVDKENKMKDDSNSTREDEVHKVKKLTGVKETNKLKALKTGALKLHSSPGAEKKNEKKKKRIASPGSAPVGRPRKSPKVEKPRSPVRREVISTSDDQNSVSDIKLPSEPDKQKLNIFKKISKVKEEHEEVKEVKVEAPVDVPKQSHVNHSMDSSPSKVPEIKHDTDEDSLDFGGRHSPLSTDDLAFIDGPSRPGTPATPKTPDLPRVSEHKKKKKDKYREKKEEKYISSPRSSIEEFPAKPKTPEVDITGVDDAMTPPFPFYPNVTFPPGPGLIPPPFSHPLIPHMPLMGPYPGIPTPPFTPKLIPPPVKEKEPPKILNIGPGGIQIPSGITLTRVPPPALSNRESPSNALVKPSVVKKKDKKDKKNKDKAKKKKDKKEKYKTKDKSEKKKIKLGKKEKDRLKSKKEKKEKKKEKEATEGKKDVSSPALPKITLKLGPASPQDTITENSHRKIVIKTLIKKEEDMDHFSKVTTLESKSTKKNHHSKKIEPQPDIFKGYGSQSTSQNIVHQMAFDMNDVKIEADPNQVWICPACQRPDDGSPMIACDLCDNWFHWTCVGIQEAIDGDWYCRECRIKKEEEAASEKKKKHKKKK